MSFCAIGNRNSGHTATENYLRETAQGLKTILQRWIANLLGHGWCPNDYIYESAQCGGLLYPIGQIQVNPESMYSPSPGIHPNNLFLKVKLGGSFTVVLKHLVL